MESKERIPNENMKLLKEIFSLKEMLNELYAQNGPNSSNYLSLSMKLKVLEREFIDQEINLFIDELDEGRKQKGIQHQEIMEIKSKYDYVLNKNQRHPSWSFVVNR
jgi:hypothetical protein